MRALSQYVPESAANEPEMKVRVSAGSALVLGLGHGRCDVLPTTAYIMCGDRCVRSCAFCSQGRASHPGRADLLSRVTWPGHDANSVIQALGGDVSGHVRRVCLQAVDAPGVLETVRGLIRSIKSVRPDLPLCVSASAYGIDEVRILLEAGADCVSLPIDAASERVYRLCKSGSYTRIVRLLADSACAFPGRIATHVIVGLGETEQELALCFQDMTDAGVGMALFAFTPIRGTAMQHVRAPELSAYRVAQAMFYLITRGYAHATEFQYSPAGSLRMFHRPWNETKMLIPPRAFETTGCPDCNRPYYNERPGDVPYNYPRPLSECEYRQALALVHSRLEEDEDANALEASGGRCCTR
ncbi:MAG: radical SAM protein [Bacillota bacterium]